MADKRISQLTDRGTVANNDVVAIVVSGAVTTNKATISSIQTFMQGNLDLGVTSVGITLGSSGTDVSVTGSPITTSGNITINIPTASAANRGVLSAADFITFNSKQGAITLTTTGTSGASTFVSNTLNIPNYAQDLSGFVTLGTAQTITAQKTFTGSGSSDTMIISHGSGSGFALDVIKAGNGEVIRVLKTSGSGNAMTVQGGNFEAPTIVKTGGTSSQFLKADGSVDSSTYYLASNPSGFTTNVGTVTSVGGTGTVSGLTLSGTVTSSGNLTLGGTLSLTSNNVTTALGFTPYNATNPSGFTSNVGTVTSVGLSSATSGVTIGATPVTTSGTITLAIATASGSQNGLLSSTDWTTFNNKQSTITNPITGTLATGQVAFATAANTLGGSNNLFWDNTNVKLGVGTNTPEATGLTVAGGGILASLTTGADRKVLELYATSTGAKVSSTYVGASSYDSLQLLTSNEARLTITAAGAATFSSSVGAKSAAFIAANNVTGTLLVQGGKEDVTGIGEINSRIDFGSNDPSVGENDGIKSGGRIASVTETNNGAFTGLAFSTYKQGRSPDLKEAVRITNAGNVGIGTATPSQPLEIGGNGNILVAAGGTFFSSGRLFIRSGAGQSLDFGANNTNSLMTLTSGGDVLVGTTDDAFFNGSVKGIGFYGPNGFIAASRSSSTCAFFNRFTSTGDIVQLRYAGSNVGSISYNGTITQYNSTSDYRLKEDLKDFNGLEIVSKLKTYDFNWKAADVRDYGMIAHELQEVLPSYVNGEKDGIDDEGNLKPQGVDYSKIVPILIKAIQELKTEIDSLKNQMQ